MAHRIVDIDRMERLERERARYARTLRHIARWPRDVDPHTVVIAHRSGVYTSANQMAREALGWSPEETARVLEQAGFVR